MTKAEKKRKARMNQIKKNRKRVKTGCGGCAKRKLKK